MFIVDPVQDSVNNKEKCYQYPNVAAKRAENIPWRFAYLSTWVTKHCEHFFLWYKIAKVKNFISTISVGKNVSEKISFLLK